MDRIQAMQMFMRVAEAGSFVRAAETLSLPASTVTSTIKNLEKYLKVRLLICLFGPELLHVDLKFITLDMLTQRVEEPAVLFTRDNDALKRQLAKFCAHWPNMTPEWFESRAWIWLHYAVVKLGRGELFEALGMLSFFREQVLGPMLFRRANLPQRGVRRIEALGIDPDGLLTSTLATHDRHSVGIAIRRAADAYVNLRADALPDNIADDAARRAVLAMLDAYSHKG